MLLLARHITSLLSEKNNIIQIIIHGLLHKRYVLYCANIPHFIVLFVTAMSFCPSETIWDWNHKWDMEFNPSKCQVIHMTRSNNPIPTQYTLHNYCILESVSSAKYLGVDISSDLSWDTHINRISKKTNNTLDFRRRNINLHSESLKSSAKFLFVLS